jgi:dynein heavy chain, axonemal
MLLFARSNTKPQESKVKRYEALGMHSSEGEYVPFPSSIVAEGPVEVWLTGVEAAMHTTLKKELQHSLVAFKKSKRDKWVKDTPGQMVITGSQIVWTQDTIALDQIVAGEKND